MVLLVLLLLKAAHLFFLFIYSTLTFLFKICLKFYLFLSIQNCWFLRACSTLAFVFMDSQCFRAFERHSAMFWLM